MKMKFLSLAAVFAIASTTALAQGSSEAGGSPQGRGPASTATPGDDRDGAAMKNDAAGSTTGSSRPSPKDPSTQGAGTAGAVDKKGDAASPGGTMKK